MTWTVKLRNCSLVIEPELSTSIRLKRSFATLRHYDGFSCSSSESFRFLSTCSLECGKLRAWPKVSLRLPTRSKSGWPTSLKCYPIFSLIFRDYLRSFLSFYLISLMAYLCIISMALAPPTFMRRGTISFLSIDSDLSSSNSLKKLRI